MLGKATISRWPGTTLNLLRFPILNLNKTRIAQRVQRLQVERKAEEERVLDKMFSKMRGHTENPKERIHEGAYVKGKLVK